MGYRISAADSEKVLEHLDYREINGYDRLEVDFHLSDEDEDSAIKHKVLVYIANEKNPSFAGAEDSLEEIGKQICSSHGKSGSNVDYLLKLAESMRFLYPKVQDQHLFDLEQVVRRQINA